MKLFGRDVHFSIERYVSSLGIAVVMPSVEISGYTNLAHGGKFYDYFTKELPEVMREFYGFSDKHEDNYICGLSMGGAGEFKIGLANPAKSSVIGGNFYRYRLINFIFFKKSIAKIFLI